MKEKEKPLMRTEKLKNCFLLLHFLVLLYFNNTGVFE